MLINLMLYLCHFQPIFNENGPSLERDTLWFKGGYAVDLVLMVSLWSHFGSSFFSVIYKKSIRMMGCLGNSHTIPWSDPGEKVQCPKLAKIVTTLNNCPPKVFAMSLNFQTSQLANQLWLPHKIVLLCCRYSSNQLLVDTNSSWLWRKSIRSRT